MASGIYLIHNTINGKVYGGHSNNMDRRFREHRKHLRAGRHKNRHLQSAWTLYGDTAFEFVVLAVLEQSELRTTEQRLLDQLFAAGNCYNTERVVGHSTLGVTKTPEQVALNRQRRLEYYANGGQSPMKGKSPSATSRAKMSDGQRKRAAKGLIPMKGKRHTHEARAQIARGAQERGKRQVANRSTHCKNGHPWDEANTYRYPNGLRYCKTCNREYQARKRAKKRSA